MKDYTGTSSRACAERIDSRILTHLLLEATDLLEESQVHAAIEIPSKANSTALSHAMWRLATTCSWVLQQLNHGWSDGNEGIRLLATAPLGDGSDNVESEPLRLFLRRTARLHERTCKLHELTTGVTRAPQEDEQGEAGRQPPPPPVPPRPAAQVIQMFPKTAVAPTEPVAANNPVHTAQTRLNWVFSAG